MRLGCLPALIAFGLMLVLPWIFADVLSTALLKLHLSSNTAEWVVIGIFAGSLVNVPVKRVERAELVPTDPLALVGLHGLWPAVRRAQAETVVAVNVGGCVIPATLAVYEVLNVIHQGGALTVLAVAVGVNIFACYRLARPVAGVGIMMPAVVPAMLAAGIALMAAPSLVTPIAFVAGVLGPLIGADLLHLRDVARIESGIVSIGGAGTFDGILLSGIVALYLS
jgi:uncharacterized membrane protein